MISSGADTGTMSGARDFTEERNKLFLFWLDIPKRIADRVSVAALLETSRIYQVA